MKTGNPAQYSAFVSPDTLLQSLRCYLMSYGREPSPHVAGSIANCLDKLLSHPQFKAPPDERCTFKRMRIYWRLIETHSQH
ncbi:hypothetical protein F6R98_07990 [Candidatus Methylospira mobilis]|uniref:Uncharacterized protein n=1 Tax=Candidatus Methylospira mobilis TaxID=1808979 RepID=A0A5Q0BSG7_9GAMM|nr:hypothetical protein F6R98_07990 [Candidatus Methylospira mobilis]